MHVVLSFFGMLVVTTFCLFDVLVVSERCKSAVVALFCIHVLYNSRCEYFLSGVRSCVCVFLAASVPFFLHVIVLCE